MIRPSTLTIPRNGPRDRRRWGEGGRAAAVTAGVAAAAATRVPAALAARIPAAVAALACLVAALAAALPAAAAEPTPSPFGGDPRSPGEGPGLVGDPVLAIGVVLAIGLAAVLVTTLWVRATGRRR